MQRLRELLLLVYGMHLLEQLGSIYILHVFHFDVM